MYMYTIPLLSQDNDMLRSLLLVQVVIPCIKHELLLTHIYIVHVHTHTHTHIHTHTHTLSCAHSHAHTYTHTHTHIHMHTHTHTHTHAHIHMHTHAHTCTLMQLGSKSKKVLHLQFTSWPDHGVPEYAGPSLTYLRRVKAESKAAKGPTVFHCR